MIEFLSQRWHGSHDEMFGYVRSVLARAREGSGLHTLVCAAHLEYLHCEVYIGRNKAVAESYWYSPQVKHEVVQAYRKSLGSPQYVETRATRWHRNFFAYTLTKAGAFREAVQEYDKIGMRPWDWPWGRYGEDSLEKFLLLRGVAKEEAAK